ncbi:hypothetical protein Tco_0633952 [Tanacetum coccineum]
MVPEVPELPTGRGSQEGYCQHRGMLSETIGGLDYKVGVAIREQRDTVTASRRLSARNTLELQAARVLIHFASAEAERSRARACESDEEDKERARARCPTTHIGDLPETLSARTIITAASLEWHEDRDHPLCRELATLRRRGTCAPQHGRTRISQRVAMDSQRVDLLMGDRMTLQETVWIVEEEAYASREAWAHSIGLSQTVHHELQTHRDHVYAHETQIQAHQTHL